MAIGDNVGKLAVDELTTQTVPELHKALDDMLAPFQALIPSIQDILQGKKKLVITLEDK